MMQCGSCTAQVAQTIPILLNPATWLLALAAIATAAARLKKK